MRSLKKLKITHVDPLCYPDDISLLLLQSRKLEELRIAWSPRMRDEGEPSINIQTIFGRCLRANYRLPVQEVALQNLFAPNNTEFDSLFDAKKLARFSFLNCVSANDPVTVFIDDTWRLKANKESPVTNLKMLRIDAVDREMAGHLARHHGLEEFYLVNAKRIRSRSSSAFRSPGGVAGTATAAHSPATPITPMSMQEVAATASEFIANITHSHGGTMRKLLLSERWQLNESSAVHLAKSCPKLEQIGLALDDRGFDILRAMVTHAPNLVAIRVLVERESEFWDRVQGMEDEMHVLPLRLELGRPQYRNVRWIGLADRYFEVGGLVENEMEWEGTEWEAVGAKPRYVREVRAVEWERIKGVEVWGMDTQEM